MPALAAELGLNPSTVGRILAHFQVPRLAASDLITGQQVRASRRSGNRYEHRAAVDLIHVDVKKLGRMPTGDGWRLYGPACPETPFPGWGWSHVRECVEELPGRAA